MKNIKFIALLLCVCGLCSAFSLKKKEKKDPTIYVCGFSASFSDSLVFITDIQQVEGAKLDKTGFLIGRSQYSYQLKSFIEEKKGVKDATCAVIYATDKKKVMKKSGKLLKTYGNNHSYVIKTLTKSDFKFTKPQDEETTE